MHLLRDYFLRASFDTTSVSSVQATVTQAATIVLKPEYDRVRSLLPQAGIDQLPTGEALIGMYAEDAPHLFQLMLTGQVVDHHQRAFAAIGIGRLFAEHAVIVFEALQQEMTLHQAKMLAFRVVQAAVTAAGPQIPVGGQVQMATVTGKSNGDIQCELLPWDDPEIKDAVDGWLGAEAMRFRDHVPPGEAAEQEQTGAQ